MRKEITIKVEDEDTLAVSVVNISNEEAVVILLQTADEIMERDIASMRKELGQEKSDLIDEIISVFTQGGN